MCIFMYKYLYMSKKVIYVMDILIALATPLITQPEIQLILLAKTYNEQFKRSVLILAYKY